MTRYFCDRCGKECSCAEMSEISLPIKKTIGGFDTKGIQVCCDCKKEYDGMISKLLDIRFIMFGDFMKERGESHDR